MMFTVYNIVSCIAIVFKISTIITLVSPPLWEAIIFLINIYYYILSYSMVKMYINSYIIYNRLLANKKIKIFILKS